MEKEIYKVKGLQLNNLKQTSPLDKWFFEMVQKTINELTIKDISCMLRQEVYLDIAIPCAWKMLLEDPFCGEMYEGEMIKSLTKTLINNPQEKSKNFYKEFVKVINLKMEEHEWEKCHNTRERNAKKGECFLEP